MQVNAPAERMASLITGLVRRLRLLERQEVSCCGVPVARAMVLQALIKGGDLRMSVLADQLGVAQSTATRLVDPLVRDGLIWRRRADDDGRAIEVGLTAKGSRLSKEVKAATLRCGSSILDQVPADKRGQVVEAMEILVSAADECCASRC